MAFTHLKVKSAKYQFTSGGLGLKNLVSFTSLISTITRQKAVILYETQTADYLTNPAYVIIIYTLLPGKFNTGRPTYPNHF